MTPRGVTPEEWQAAHEALGSVWTFLDLTPLGWHWEDSPPGAPQGSRYEWWDWHDRSEATPARG